MTQTTISFLDSILHALDEMMTSDSADDLFVSGYLRGHITLIAGQLETEQTDIDKDLLKQAVERSLLTARQSGELNQQDTELVYHCWQAISD